MRPTTRRGRLALGIFAILALAIVGVFGFGIYEEYAYVPGETFVIAPCEVDGRIALQVDGGDQARATGITIGGVKAGACTASTSDDAMAGSGHRAFRSVPRAIRGNHRGACHARCFGEETYGVEGRCVPAL